MSDIISIKIKARSGITEEELYKLSPDIFYSSNIVQTLIKMLKLGYKWDESKQAYI